MTFYRPESVRENVFRVDFRTQTLGRGGATSRCPRLCLGGPSRYQVRPKQKGSSETTQVNRPFIGREVDFLSRLTNPTVEFLTLTLESSLVSSNYDSSFPLTFQLLLTVLAITMYNPPRQKKNIFTQNLYKIYLLFERLNEQTINFVSNKKTVDISRSYVRYLI